MNVHNALILVDWVKKNKAAIQLSQKTQGQLATQASEALGFKCSTSSVKEALAANGLQSKRQTKHDRELLARDDEIKALRTCLIKVVTASNVPEWLRAELLTEGLHEEIKEAIRGKRSA